MYIYNSECILCTTLVYIVYFSVYCVLQCILCTTVYTVYDNVYLRQCIVYSCKISPRNYKLKYETVRVGILRAFSYTNGSIKLALQCSIIKYQSQKQSLYPRAPLKSLEIPLMIGSSFWTWRLTFENIKFGFLVKF